MRIIIIFLITIFVSGCDGIEGWGRYSGGSCFALVDGTPIPSACWDYSSPTYGINYRVDDFGNNASAEDYGKRIDLAFEYATRCLGVRPNIPSNYVIVITDDIDQPFGGRFYSWYGIITSRPKLSQFIGIAEHEFIHALLFINYGYNDHQHNSGCYPSGSVM